MFLSDLLSRFFLLYELFFSCGVQYDTSIERISSSHRHFQIDELRAESLKNSLWVCG